MAKNNKNTKDRDAFNRVLTKKSAELAGVSVSTAEKVLRMERNNEAVLTSYLMLNEGFNKLLAEVKRILPDLRLENERTRSNNAKKIGKNAPKMKAKMA